jgi:hypothetical protein
MKSLNDSLREEFNNVLRQSVLSEKIKSDELDTDILNKAFDVLLKFKSDAHATDKARSEFENYLINHLRTKNNSI